MLVNGNVMPNRIPQNPVRDTDAQQVLRGEDICFLGEAAQQRTGGCLSGAVLFGQRLDGAGPLSFTKKLSRQQLNDFLAEYRTLASNDFFYRNGLSAGVDYFLQDELPGRQVKQADLLLRDFQTDFSNSLEKQPLLNAFEDLKVLSCSAFRIDLSSAAAPGSGQYYPYPQSYYGPNCTCPAATLDSPFVVKCQTRGPGANDDYGPTYTALSGVVGYVEELADVNGEAELWVKTTVKQQTDAVEGYNPPGILSSFGATGFFKLGDGRLRNGRFDLQMDERNIPYNDIHKLVGSYNAWDMVGYRYYKEGLPYPDTIAVMQSNYFQFHYTLSCENTEYWVFCKHGDHTKWW